MNVLVFGTFDRLHQGHEFVLHEGLKRGELHVVVARDSTVKRIKGRSAEQSEQERVDAIQKKFPKANVVLGDNENYLKPVRTIDPDLVLLGYDQKLPPGVTIEDFFCPVERLGAFEPERFKSSLRRG
ncbi:MAG: glycerol-3-phosphate cytidylyltransferase [Candidatus Peregrinibacteria bacterium Greene0416_62]|nr:MAG: glycerol-3-phosphate cytidylyltransferase [Candidatus Peregrinibacteria bacterium Greene0416_62]TSC99813.1 MAG: glycerol-3-phosphate cytidylyltransferase [Candidatus Peregrinibacteria bacterium Greene1014_49]